MRCGFMIIGLALVLAGSASGQVNLPEGFEIVEFAVNDKMTRSPAINNCGEIVYVKDNKQDSRVFLYDNGKITRLTDDDQGRLVSGPDINDDGTIVWMRGYFNQHDTFRIIMLERGERTIVGKGYQPSINSFGRMAWQLFRRYTCHPEVDIVFFDGESAIELTDNRFCDQSAEINDNDWITWGESDGCVVPWVGDVRLYVDGEIHVLPSGSPQSHVATINNLGQVAWGAGPPINGTEFWENGETVVLIDRGNNPRLNNLGDIYFLRFHPENNDSWDSWLYRVSNGGPVIHRLTDDNVWNTDGDINDWVEMAWRWKDGPGIKHGGLRFMRRVRTGDAEFDGDVDLIDHAAFAECMTGPGRVDRLCDCRFLDIDHDGDVDLSDFARFQNGFTGD